MSPATVDEILELIEKLPDQERVLLETRLAQRLDEDWSRAVAENRRVAGERGIDERAIEDAIHRRRYGE